MQQTKPSRRFVLHCGLVSVLWPGHALADKDEPRRVLRMGYFNRYPPLSYLNAAGQMQGILIDLVNTVGAIAKLEFEHHGFPWLRAQQMVSRGELDGLCTNATPARKEYALFCETPVATATMGMFHRRDDKRPLKIRAVADMRALRQGNYRGSGFAAQHLEVDRIVFDNDAESILRRIAMGDLDIYVADDLVTLPQIKRLGLADQISYLPTSFLPPSMYRWGLRKTYPNAEHLVQLMESSTKAAQLNGSLAAVIERY